MTRYVDAWNGVRNTHEHRLIAQRVLCGPVPSWVQVHHVNRVRDDNSPGNLVICEDHSYHALLHKRQEALEATGDPRKRRCNFCKQWDSPENLRENRTNTWHAECGKAYQRDRIARKKRRDVGLPETASTSELLLRKSALGLRKKPGLGTRLKCDHGPEHWKPRTKQGVYCATCLSEYGKRRYQARKNLL